MVQYLAVTGGLHFNRKGELVPMKSEEKTRMPTEEEKARIVEREDSLIVPFHKVTPVAFVDQTQDRHDAGSRH